MKSALLDDIRLRCLRSLDTWYPAVEHSNSSLALTGEKSFRWSKHYLFRTDGKSKTDTIDILAKHSIARDTSGHTQGDVRPHSDALMMEFQALSLLYKHLSTADIKGVTAVRPLDYFSDIDVLAIEYLPGEHMLSLLSNATKPWATRADLQVALSAAYNGGRLLGAIHMIPRSPHPKRMPVDSEQYLQAFKESVESLLELVSDQGVQTRLAAVQKAVEEHILALREEVTVTHLHGDYYPKNLVRSQDGRVFTVDTTLHSFGPVEYDIAKFLVGIGTTKRRLLAGQFLVQPSTVKTVKMRFIEGYCTQGQFSHRMLLLAELRACIHRWVEILSALEAAQLPPLLVSTIKRTRINPIMLTYVVTIWTALSRGNSDKMSNCEAGRHSQGGTAA